MDVQYISLKRTILKGTQDPSVQVNSGQMRVVFLLPGSSGETVLSGQSKISKVSLNKPNDHKIHQL